MGRILDLAINQGFIGILLGVGALTYNLSLYSEASRNPFPEFFIYFGIFIQATSVTLFVAQLAHSEPGRVQQRFQLFFLFLLSISLSFTRLSRYAGFSGFDLIRENSVLQNTAASGFWDPALGASSPYQSSLAITVLPTMTSAISQVSASQLLLFQTFFFFALLPIAVYAVVNSITNDSELAALSSLALALNWFFFGAHIIGKTAPALLLFFLAFYALTGKEHSVRSLGIILCLGVAMSHYTISIALAFVLVAWLVISKIVVPILQRLPFFEKSSPIQVTVTPLLASLALVTLWLAFAAPTILSQAFTSIQQVLFSISHLSSGPKRADTSLAISSAAGPIVTGWFDFQNGLIALGALLFLNRYRRGLTRGIFATWNLMGASLIGLLGAWLALPYVSVAIESTRILAIILPFITFFLAGLLWRIFKSHQSLWKGTVLVLIFVMLPMNLMLPNQERNSLYHSRDSLPLDARLDVDSSLIPNAANAAVAAWVNSNVPANKPLEVDSVGRYAIITAVPFPPKLGFAQEPSPPYNFSRYAILSSYFVDHDIWSTSILGSSIQVTADPSPFFSPTHNIVYSSSVFWVASPP